MNMVDDFICWICCLGIADQYEFRGGGHVGGTWIGAFIFFSPARGFSWLIAKSMKKKQRQVAVSIYYFSDLIPTIPLTKRDDKSRVVPPPAATDLNLKVSSATVHCPCLQVKKMLICHFALGWWLKPLQNKLTKQSHNHNNLSWTSVTSSSNSCGKVVCPRDRFEQYKLNSRAIWLFSKEAKMSHTSAIIEACLIPVVWLGFKNRNADNIFFNWIFTVKITRVYMYLMWTSAVVTCLVLSDLLRCLCYLHRRFPWRHCTRCPSNPSCTHSASCSVPWCTARFHCTGSDSHLQRR